MCKIGLAIWVMLLQALAASCCAHTARSEVPSGSSMARATLRRAAFCVNGSKQRRQTCPAGLRSPACGAPAQQNTSWQSNGCLLNLSRSLLSLQDRWEGRAYIANRVKHLATSSLHGDIFMLPQAQHIMHL